MQNDIYKDTTSEMSGNDALEQLFIAQKHIRELEERLAKLELSGSQQPLLNKVSNKVTALLSSASQTISTTIKSQKVKIKSASTYLYDKTREQKDKTIKVVKYIKRNFRHIVFSREALEILAFGTTTAGIAALAYQYNVLAKEKIQQDRTLRQLEEKTILSNAQQVSNSLIISSQTATNPVELEISKLMVLGWCANYDNDFWRAFGYSKFNLEESLYLDCERAVKTIKKEAKKNNTDAQRIIGLLFMRGYFRYLSTFEEQNVSKALEWYGKAGHQGNMDAQNALGNIYFYASDKICDILNRKYADEQYRTKRYQEETEKHKVKDYQDAYEKAIFWYEKASNQGNNIAKRNLQKLKQKEKCVLR